MNISVVSRYAKALLSLAKQRGVHAKTLEQLKTIDQALMGDPQLREFFESPVVSPDQKIQVLRAALENKGLLEETLSTILLLAEKGRLPAFSSFVEAFQQGIDQENGITRGTIRAAKPLAAEAQAELEKKITQVLKKKIVLTFKEDPTLLGGVIAQVGGWTFDDSIETHLKKMNEELNRGAN